MRVLTKIRFPQSGRIKQHFSPAAWILIFTLCGVFNSFVTQAQTPNTITGLLLWLDANDPDGDGNAANNPVSGGNLAAWIDKSGNGNNTSVVGGQNTPVFISSSADLINGVPVVRFASVNRNLGSVYQVAGVDLRSSVNEDISIFTVYRPRAKYSTRSQGVWGNDNGGFDRFYFSSYEVSGAGTNGLASKGGGGEIVPSAGEVGTVRLMTAIYDGNNATPNSSAIYFDGEVVATFQDLSSSTDAHTNMFIGWDGDDNTYDGDIAEIIVYNKKLNDCELQQVNKYLAQKYGRSFGGVATAPGGVKDNSACNLGTGIK